MTDQITTSNAVPVAGVLPPVSSAPHGPRGTKPVRVATNGVQTSTFVAAGAIILGIDLSQHEQWAYGIATGVLLVVFQLLGGMAPGERDPRAASPERHRPSVRGRPGVWCREQAGFANQVTPERR